MTLVGIIASLNYKDNFPITFGEKTLIPGEPLSTKEEGMKYVKEKKWQQAANSFKESLKKAPNDPETRIFLNNAKVQLNKALPKYTIAVSVPITKNNNDQNNALEILRGVAQAQDENNSNESSNRFLLKVKIASDKNNPEDAKQIATALAKDSEVLGVVGHYASDVTIAAKSIYESRELVAITPISTSICLTKTPLSIKSPICKNQNYDRSNGSKTYVFRTVPSDTQTANKLENYIKQNWNEKKVAVFFDSNSDYSKSLKFEFKKAFEEAGGSITEEFNLYEQNFNPAQSVEEAVEDGAEVLMLASSTNTLEQTKKVVKASAQHELKIIAGDDVYTPDILNIGDEAIGMVVAAFWHIDRSNTNNESSKFVNKSKELWGGADVNWRTALAYDATQALIAAIDRQQTRSGVKEELNLGAFYASGAFGKIEFEPSGDRKNSPVQLVCVVRKNNNNYEFNICTYPEQLPKIGILRTNSDGENVNIREQCTRKSKVIVSPPSGTEVKITSKPLKQNDGYSWYRVIHDNKEGCVRDDVITEKK
ncbi:ABC transporter substrate-binding protein [Plectonema radiosum]|uniref:ABC transporter substrate-binding protein n=1 Tax=Plectonema radiosum TaxID=945768 RepID=UPI001D13D8F0|nr:ABC transporter substrate-binding protein [Plectonema radiosum]